MSVLTCKPFFSIWQAKNQAGQQQATPSSGQSEDLIKGGSEGKLSPLQALFSPPGLQQMQQFLQQVANNNGSAGAPAAPSAGAIWTFPTR